MEEENAIFRAEMRIFSPAHVNLCMKSNGTDYQRKPIDRKAIAKRSIGAQENSMVKKSPLDDPENAAHAWAHYRKIMRLLMMVTVVTVLIALGLVYAYNGMVSIHLYIAVAIGVSFTMLLGGGLMGLAFLSAGTGHDESVDNRLPRADELWSTDDNKVDPR